MTRLCRFQRDGDACRCIDCGQAFRVSDCGTLKANCVADGPGPPPPGLGDHTERLLKSLGVTPDRYRAAKELFGLAPTCGCEERKAWLNRVGQWFGM